MIHDDLARVRRRDLLRILNQLDGQKDKHIGPGRRVHCLVESKKVPRYVASLMRVILEVRNASEYDDLELSPAQEEAVRGAWIAILEWWERRTSTAA